jgi:hypothetical protein
VNTTTSACMIPCHQLQARALGLQQSVGPCKGTYRQPPQNRQQNVDQESLVHTGREHHCERWQNDAQDHHTMQQQQQQDRSPTIASSRNWLQAKEDVPESHNDVPHRAMVEGTYTATTRGLLRGKAARRDRSKKQRQRRESRERGDFREVPTCSKRTHHQNPHTVLILVTFERRFLSSNVSSDLSRFGCTGRSMNQLKKYRRLKVLEETKLSNRLALLEAEVEKAKVLPFLFSLCRPPS